MSEISYFSSPIAVGAWCEEQTGGGAPVGSYCVAPPELCIFDLETLKLTAVAPAKYFPGASNYSLELWKPSVESWQVYLYEVGPDETVLIETAYEIGLRARFAVAYDGLTLYSEDVPVTRFCCEGVLPPEVPAPPVLARNCAETSITVTSPAFSDVEGAETETVEIQRSSDNGSTWELVHTFESASTWTDEGVVAGGEYLYRARGCNDGGCSAWSAPAAVDLISQTLQLAFLSPAGGGSLRGYVQFKFAVADSEGSYTGVQLRINGALVQPSPQKQGDVYVLLYDTRNAGQGAAVATIEAVGSDGCLKRASLHLTFANTRYDGVLYRDFLTRTARPGYTISKLRAQIALGKISDNPVHRFWGQAAVTTDTSVPPVSLETDPEEAQAQFDAMRPMPMETWKSWPQLGPHEAGRIIRGGGIIAGAGTPGAGTPGAKQQVKLRVRQERAEWFLAYDTRSESVSKIRTASEAKYFVLARRPDRAFFYDGERLNELVDLEADTDIGAVSDAAHARDKIYFISEGGELIAYDIEPLTGPRNRTLQIDVRREGRVPRFVEGMGGFVSLLLIDPALEEAQTLCVTLEGDQMLDRWTLDGAATLAWSQGGSASDLYIACGGELYFSARGTGAPQLLGSFSEAITAICPTGVGLADGSVWGYDPKNHIWTEGVTGSPEGSAGSPEGAEPVSAIAGWWGSLEFPNLLWGTGAENALFGQDGSGGYTVQHPLDVLDGVLVEGVASLGRYFVADSQGGQAPEESAPDDPDSSDLDHRNVSSQVKGDERMLIGTRGGFLLALMLSRKTRANAWLHTTLSSINLAEVVVKKKS